MLIPQIYYNIILIICMTGRNITHSAIFAILDHKVAIVDFAIIFFIFFGALLSPAINGQSPRKVWKFERWIDTFIQLIVSKYTFGCEPSFVNMANSMFLKEQASGIWPDLYPLFWLFKHLQSWNDSHFCTFQSYALIFDFLLKRQKLCHIFVIFRAS